MITNSRIKNLIETMLNEKAGNLSYDKMFKGDVSTYTHEWVQRWCDEPINPFCLEPTSREPINDGLDSYRYRFTLFILAFAEDKDVILEIVNGLVNSFSSNENIEVDGNKLSFEPYLQEYGPDFSEGSGHGIKRFEVSLSFSVVANSNVYNTKDIEVKFGDDEVPVLSIRQTHGKVDYVNIEGTVAGYDNDVNGSLNTNAFVVEAPVYKDGAIEDLINTKQKSNVIRNLDLKIGDITIIDQEKYAYRGYEISNRRNDLVAVYLFFERAKKEATIKINDLTVPILTHAVSTVFLTTSHNQPNVSQIKNLYLGNKTTAYTFTVADSSVNQEFIDEMYSLMLDSGDIINPFIDVELTIRDGVVYTKNLVITDITKEIVDGKDSYFSIKFLDGGDL